MVVPYAQASERVSVAAAANLTYVMEPLNAAFEKANPDVVVHSEIGASGSLVSQIENGAPYDIFLSADTEYPRKLIKAGSAQESSFVIFARGRLVLWTTSTGLRMDSVESVLKNEAVRKVAIANPETAPYGRAAMEVLSRMGLSETVKSKIVTGDNITQTAQFVSTGNADIGFVALSLVKSPKLADKGAWLEIPASLYAPIDQAAVLTSRGAASAGALRYIKFMESEDARKVFGAFGYGLPDINPSSATAAGKTAK